MSADRKEYFKEYYKQNKDIINARCKERYKNDEKVRAICSEKNKKYYNEHKEARKKYYQDYYEKNKIAIKLYHKEWYQRKKKEVQENVHTAI